MATPWRDWPSYFDVVVPRVLSLLAERGLTITFFVVGPDADPGAPRALQAITDAGHDIGNHCSTCTSHGCTSTTGPRSTPISGVRTRP